MRPSASRTWPIGHQSLSALGATRGLSSCHPFIIGELVCGSLQGRREVLELLAALPQVVEADHAEVLSLVDFENLFGCDQTNASGDAREESYYPAFAQLLSEAADHAGHDSVRVTVNPRPTEGGDPDFRVRNSRAVRA